MVTILSVDAVSDIGSNGLTFSLTLSEPAPSAGSVSVRVTSQAALEGSDIDTIATTVAIPAGAESVPFTVGTFGNGTDVDEPVVLEFFDPVNVELPGGVLMVQATGNVLDDDGDSTGGSAAVTVTDDELPLLGLSFQAIEIAENGGTTTATLTRTGDNVGALVVALTSSDTTEASVPAEVILTDGAGALTFIITGVDDDEVDGSQTVTIAVEAAGAKGTDLDIRILDDDVLPPDPIILTLTLDADTIAEGGSTTATVTRDGDLVGPLVVFLSSDDESAATVSADVTIPDGETSATFTVTGTDDIDDDGDQEATISVTAMEAEGATTDITVTDDEAEAPYLVLSIPQTANEGETVEGTLNRFQVVDGEIVSPTEGALSIALTSGLPAAAAIPDGVTIPDGASEVTFDLVFPENDIFDDDRAVEVTAAADGVTPAAETVTVLDDEDAPQDPVTLGLALTVDTIEEGATTTATITRDGDPVGDLVVTLTSSDETAATVPATATIPDGAAAASIEVTGTDDDEDDGDQTTTLSASAEGATGASASLTVTDEDMPPPPVVEDNDDDSFFAQNSRDGEGVSGAVAIAGYGGEDALQTAEALVDANGDGIIAFGGGNGVLDLFEPNDGGATLDLEGFSGVDDLQSATGEPADGDLFLYAPLAEDGADGVTYSFAEDAAGAFGIGGFDSRDTIRMAAQATLTEQDGDLLLAFGDAQVTVEDITRLVESFDDGMWVYTVGG